MGQIGGIIVSTYVDAFRVVRDLWGTVLMSALITAVVNLAGGLFQSQIPTLLGDTVMTMLTVVAGIWFTAPYTVAQYRYLAYGERNLWPSPFERSLVIDKVFAWGELISIVWAVPALIYVVTRPHFDGPVYYTGPNRPDFHGNIELAFLVGISIAIATLRLATLIPGTALGDAPTIGRARSDVRGHFWTIVASQTLVLLPLALLLFFAISAKGIFGARLGLAQPVLLVVASFVTNLLIVALGTQFYRRFTTAPPSASA